MHGLKAPSLPVFPILQLPGCHASSNLMSGGYLLRRHPSLWSAGVAALPGPCYWLVASGTPRAGTEAA